MTGLAALPILLLFQAAAPSRPRDLNKIVAPILKQYKLPALGGAIVTSEGLEAIGVAGVRSWRRLAKVTVEDQWHIGSCSKAITATLAARLIERGLLTWETTIGDVLGPSVPAMDSAWRRVTLTWLLSHRSGAAPNPPDTLWEQMVRRGGPLRDQRRILIAGSLTTAPDAPNTKTVYSNLGVLIAGVMLETVADMPWEELVRREVFVPLGMTRTGFGAPGTPGRLDQPLGHTRGSHGWSPVALGPGDDNPAATGPAGSVHTTLRDWARFVAAHLRAGRDGGGFLTAESWRRLHSTGGADWGYSPGWVVTEQAWAGGTVLRHVGSNNFWVAEATLAPGKDIAILLVTNVADDTAEGAFKDLLAALVASALAGKPRGP